MRKVNLRMYHPYHNQYRCFNERLGQVQKFYKKLVTGEARKELIRSILVTGRKVQDCREMLRTSFRDTFKKQKV